LKGSRSFPDSRSNLESRCEPQDIYEGEIPLAPFESANVVGMEIREFHELLLREAPFEAELGAWFPKIVLALAGTQPSFD